MLHRALHAGDERRLGAAVRAVQQDQAVGPPFAREVRDQAVDGGLDLLLAHERVLAGVEGQSKSRQRVIRPRGVRTDSVPKWSKTSRRYWPAERSWRAGSAPNSVRYSANEMTRRLRAKLSRISPVVSASQPLESNARALSGASVLARMRRAGRDRHPWWFHGSTRLRSPHPCITSPTGPSTVLKEPMNRSTSSARALLLGARFLTLPAAGRWPPTRQTRQQGRARKPKADRRETGEDRTTDAADEVRRQDRRTRRPANPRKRSRPPPASSSPMAELKKSNEKLDKSSRRTAPTGRPRRSCSARRSASSSARSWTTASWRADRWPVIGNDHGEAARGLREHAARAGRTQLPQAGSRKRQLQHQVRKRDQGRQRGDRHRHAATRWRAARR